MATEHDETIEEEVLEDEEGEVAIPPKTGEEEVIEEEGGEEEEVVEEPYKTFSSQEELDAYIAEQQQAATPPTPPETPPATPDAPKPIFEDDWKPQNWNDFAEKLLESPAAIERLSKHLAPEAAKALQDMTLAEQQELEEINKGFDAEYDAIAKSGKVPARNSEEGEKINEQITQIGAQYGLSSMTKAHELWSKIPVAEGGGLEYEPPATKKLNEQKKRSGMIGKPKGTKAPSTRKETKYEELHNKSLDDLIDEEDLD